MHVIYKVNQAEYAIRIHVAAPQENVTTDSTRRSPTHEQALVCFSNRE